MIFLRGYSVVGLLLIPFLALASPGIDDRCPLILESEPELYPSDAVKTAQNDFESEKANIKEDYLGSLSEGIGDGYHPVERKMPLFLSGENGREKLEVVRIVLSNAWTLQTLKDYLQVMDKMPSLKLMVVFPEDLKKEVNEYLGKVSKSIRNRVNLKQMDRVRGGSEWTQDGSKPLISSARPPLHPPDIPEKFIAKSWMSFRKLIFYPSRTLPSFLRGGM